MRAAVIRIGVEDAADAAGVAGVGGLVDVVGVSGYSGCSGSVSESGGGGVLGRNIDQR